MGAMGGGQAGGAAFFCAARPQRRPRQVWRHMYGVQGFAFLPADSRNGPHFPGFSARRTRSWSCVFLCRPAHLDPSLGTRTRPRKSRNEHSCRPSGGRRPGAFREFRQCTNLGRAGLLIQAAAGRHAGPPPPLAPGAQLPGRPVRELWQRTQRPDGGRCCPGWGRKVERRPTTFAGVHAGLTVGAAARTSSEKSRHTPLAPGQAPGVRIPPTPYMWRHTYGRAPLSCSSPKNGPANPRPSLQGRPGALIPPPFDVGGIGQGHRGGLQHSPKKTPRRA